MTKIYYFKGIKVCGYLILRLEKKSILRVFIFAIWWLQKISWVFNFAISVKIRKKVLLNNNFSIANKCNCYQICCRNSNFVTISTYMRYTGTIIILWSNIRKKKIIKLGRYQFRGYLILPYFGFKTFCGYKSSRKWWKIVKITKFSTREI